ncbi:MAG: hypothetical protein GF330_05850 [Candidatus Eisenbacteria bacterium]|nr:hypothetical protein [Candidatus Eisenbacteria bacterium]
MNARRSSQWLALLGMALGICVILALAGCSSEDVSGSPLALADASASEADGDQDATDGQQDRPEPGPHAYLPRPMRGEEIPAGGVYDASTQWFVCPPEVEEHGVTIERSYAFYDASGAHQEAYDEELTVAIGLRLQLEAHPEQDGRSGSILAQHDLLVRGLAGAEESRAWRGTMTLETEGVPPHPRGARPQGGEGHGDGERPGGPPGRGERPGGPPGQGDLPRGLGGGDRPGGPPGGGDRRDPQDLMVAETTKIEEVVLPHPLGEESWPLSGSIVREMRISGGPEDPMHSASTLTFNGTRYATLTVDEESQELDLLDPRQPPRTPQQ